ncbi:MAG: hypothetical protein QM731_25390 [Chitinophagaceae bacterium]
MKKNMMQFGKSLSRNEMKNISGGLVKVYRWACYEGGNTTLAFYNCRTDDPTPYCGYDFCNVVGTCTTATNCS